MRLNRCLFKTLSLLLALLALTTACDVHEIPEFPEAEPLVLRLQFDTDLTPWHHSVKQSQVSEVSVGTPAPSLCTNGVMRYVVAAYPMLNGRVLSSQLVRQFAFDRTLNGGYDNSLTVALPAGDYKVMVWADLRANALEAPFYLTDDFAEITLQGSYRGSTILRDAFRGTADASVTTSIVLHDPDTINIAMQRPMARYEFISTDLKEFIDKEVENTRTRGETSEVEEKAPYRRIDTNDYRIVFYYNGFMPSAYNMFLDKPVDSSTNVHFTSQITQLNDKEASIGFDYVFVNGKSTSVTTQIAIYNRAGERISLTDPIDIPLKRSHHTILRGAFLTQSSSKGLVINPDFEGEYNIIIP